MANQLSVQRDRNESHPVQYIYPASSFKPQDDAVSKVAPLTPAQRILVQTYCCGEFSYVRTPEQAKAVGDTLFTYLFLELSAGEDCDGMTEARRRTAIALREMMEVYVRLRDPIEIDMLSLGQIRSALAADICPDTPVDGQ